MTSNNCLTCKHWWGGLKCSAYPDRIPDEFLQGLEKHTQITPGQVGTFVWEFDPVWNADNNASSNTE